MLLGRCFLVFFCCVMQLWDVSPSPGDRTQAAAVKSQHPKQKAPRQLLHCGTFSCTPGLTHLVAVALPYGPQLQGWRLLPDFAKCPHGVGVGGGPWFRTTGRKETGFQSLKDNLTTGLSGDPPIIQWASQGQRPSLTCLLSLPLMLTCSS